MSKVKREAKKQAKLHAQREKEYARQAKKVARYERLEKLLLSEAKPGDIYVTYKVPMIGAEPLIRRGWEQVQTTRYTIGIQNFHTLRIPVAVLEERYCG